MPGVPLTPDELLTTTRSVRKRLDLTRPAINLLRLAGKDRFQLPQSLFLGLQVFLLRSNQLLL